MNEKNEEKEKEKKFQFMTIEQLEQEEDVLENKVVPVNINEKKLDSIEILDMDEESYPFKIEGNKELNTFFAGQEEEMPREEESNPLEIEKESIKENSKEEEVNEKDFPKKNLGHKVYFGFEERVVSMVFGILLLFVVACLLIFKIFNDGRDVKVSYEESKVIDYEVCLLPNTTYTNSCLEENLEYISSITDTVNSHFLYNRKFSSNISYESSYYIDAVVRVYDKNDSNDVHSIYTDYLVENKNVSITNDFVSIDENVVINYQKYLEFASHWVEENEIDGLKELVVTLYVGEEKISSLLIPLEESSYVISKDFSSKGVNEIIIDGDIWTQYNISLAIISSALILISIYLIYQIAKLVLKVTNNHNRYQEYLRELLTEYDSLIVIARGGYESDSVKNVIKVDSFEELLDAREILQKPIIYSRVNNVKSEFIVEDDIKIYKFVLKEADLEEGEKYE